MFFPTAVRSVDTHGQSHGTLPFEPFRKAGDVDKDDGIHSWISDRVNPKRIGPQALTNAQDPLRSS